MRAWHLIMWVSEAYINEVWRARSGNPVADRYRAPDEKTIRVVLDRLDPRALARALLGDRPVSCRGRGEPPPPASVRGYRAWQAAQQAKALARDR
jgi:hypothetical protein